MNTKNAADTSFSGLLIGLGLSTKDSIVQYQERVRDRDDVAVLRCNRSEVLLLSRTDHITERTYAEWKGFSYWGSRTRKEALAKTFVDDSRRARMIQPFVQGRRWLDVGTGLGGILDLCENVAGEISAVEPQAEVRGVLSEAGYKVFASLQDVPDDSLDFITMFHMYGHVTDPIGFLQHAMQKLTPGGSLCIEGPHARDALLALYDCEAFRRFSLSSEQLIVHTRQSLGRFLAAAGFVSTCIVGIQRYPLANHLYWLAKGKPGGHLHWSQLCNDALDGDYGQKLASMDMTDTLVAFARKPT